jgi:hypothetical protein
VSAYSVANAKAAKASFYDWLEGRRSTLEGAPMSSVALLNLIYDEPEP